MVGPQEDPAGGFVERDGDGLMSEAVSPVWVEGAEVNLHRSGDIQLPTPPAGFITRPRTLLGFFFFFNE